MLSPRSSSAPLLLPLVLAVVSPGTAQALCGDCSGDGAVSIVDALTAAQIAAVILVPGPDQLIDCDVDSSGAITVLDALVMAQEAAGLTPGMSCPPRPVPGTWVLLSPAASPPARTGHAMAFDEARQEVVLFGGSTAPGPAGLYLGDTWVWNGVTWTQRLPAVSPAPRTGPRMVYDSVRQIVVLFGGWVSGTIANDETWVWDGSTWTQRFPATVPPFRANHAMAFDRGRGVAAIWGGYGGGIVYLPADDTWEWDGTDWSNPLPPSHPPGVEGAGMTYDEGHGEVLFHAEGGTYVWDGVSWSSRSPATSPPGRVYHAMDFDPWRGVTVLFGGVGSLDDTWEWDGVMWTQLSPTTSPQGRVAATMVYDRTRGSFLLFGGHSDLTQMVYGDTWRF